MRMSTLPDRSGEPIPQISCIPTGLLEANCYLVVCSQTGEALLIDPGADPGRLLEHIRIAGCRVTRILHTHGHYDHISATESILDGLGQRPPVAAHGADEYLYAREEREAGARYGYPVPDMLAVPDQHLSDGDAVRIGNLQMKVIHTPGHTPGSISLICGNTCVFTGDTLFRHGIGRTDLVGGDEEAIYESILTRLYPLTESLTVYPGHGSETSIGEERHANPFVQAK